MTDLGAVGDDPVATAAPARIVVVGFGAAGLSVAEGLRRGGWDGKLTIIAQEDHLPYDRPPLSKKFLRPDHDDARLDLANEQRVAALDARILLGRSATQLDLAAQVVTDSTGEQHPYDDLVITTGVGARRLDGADLAQVHVLRTRDDAAGLRACLRPGRRLTVIGGGFLGLESAATARDLGLDVTVIEPTTHPLASRIGQIASRRLLALHRGKGVDVRVGIGVKQLVADTDADAGASGAVVVELDDGERVVSDIVLVAVGSVPQTSWLDDSGLDLRGGIVCDELCRAAPHVWAAGDVCRWFHRGLSELVRLEHRTNSAEQGLALARNILGAETPFSPVPFFWTDQYDQRLQSAGVIDAAATEELVLGDPDGTSFVTTFSVDGTLRGVVGWNAARDLMPYRRALAESLSRTERPASC